MKIALVNYRYFISGGPERYYFNIKEILEKNGHVVIPFSIKSARNIPLLLTNQEVEGNMTDKEYEERYFLDIVDDEVYFAQAKKKTPMMIIKSFTRMFYSFEAKKKMRKLIREQKPDLVYIMQMHNKISPSIVDAARAEGVPVVHRISDFQYMCPNALFYNDKVGVCEECLKGNRMACVKNKCVLNSTVYSGIKMVAKWMHDVMKIHERIDQFVVPSEFTYEKLHEYGIPYDKLNHIPTFFNLKEKNPKVEYKPYMLFVGRIEKQKGLKTLVKAFEELPYELKIIGFSNDGYEDELKKYLGRPLGDSNIGDNSIIYGKYGNIHFLGKKNFDEITPYLKTCLCTTVPSEWYDNFPNSLIESYAFKKAVIATDFGSLAYMVKTPTTLLLNRDDGPIEDCTGLKFKYADIEDFREKIRWMFEHQDEAKKMGENGFKLIETIYSPETHYQTLMKIFEKLVKK